MWASKGIHFFCEGLLCLCISLVEGTTYRTSIQILVNYHNDSAVHSWTGQHQSSLLLVMCMYIVHTAHVPERVQSSVLSVYCKPVPLR